MPSLATLGSLEAFATSSVGTTAVLCPPGANVGPELPGTVGGIPRVATAVTLFSVCLGTALAVVWSVAPPTSPAAGARMGAFEVAGFVVMAGSLLVLSSSWENERGGSSSSSSAESASAERIVSWPRAESRWLRVRASERRERGRRSRRPDCGSGGRAVTRGSRVALQRPLLAAAAAELG